MSAKASVKLMLPEDAKSKLFKWVAILTGSKNALKGAGFFLGGLLLNTVGFKPALIILAGSLFSLLILSLLLLPARMGKTRTKTRFKHLFSRSHSINTLSAARLFLFAARDIWFVVGLPVYLSSELNWSHTEVGGFIALWVIGYGLIQAIAPGLLRHSHHDKGPDGSTARLWVLILAGISFTIPLLLMYQVNPAIVVVMGLAIFGVVFAINSSIHSYLILSYSTHDNVATDVGFYYMANASGRLLGTVLSGGVYQLWGITGCLHGAVIFLVVAGIISLRLPK